MWPLFTAGQVCFIDISNDGNAQGFFHQVHKTMAPIRQEFLNLRFP
jgi:hypothetical protein